DAFEDEVLPGWAEAYLAGRPDVDSHRERARLVADALSRVTGGALPQDAVRALADPTATAASRDPLRSQALGYRALREASRLHDLQQPACAEFRGALGDLDGGGSPYAAWARQLIVSTCRYYSELQAT